MNKKCPYCKGSGQVFQEWPEECSDCGGYGKIYSAKANSLSNLSEGELEQMGEVTRCSRCNGTGRMMVGEFIECKHCEGTGEI